MDPGTVVNWGMDWAWGLPLIVLTVVIHAYGLAFLDKKVSLGLTMRAALEPSLSPRLW